MITIREQSRNVKKGDKFGFVIVLGKPFSIGDTHYLVVVKCKKCKTVYTVTTKSLNQNKPSRCSDCSRKEITHGESNTRLYRIWAGVKARCLNPNDTGYKDYGGRGIRICAAWENSFEIFRDWALKNGYSSELQLDRKKNNLGYSPNNCRWVTNKVNSRNKRTNNYIMAFGETKCLTEWLEDKRCKASLDALRWRIKNSWNPEEAITTVTGKRSFK